MYDDFQVAVKFLYLAAGTGIAAFLRKCIRSVPEIITSTVVFSFSFSFFKKIKVEFLIF